MNKKYIVRLNDEERKELIEVITKLKGTSQKVRRANILLKSHVDGPNWPDAKIAEAFSCRTRTVENVRRRLVTEGLDAVLNRKKRDTPPRPSIVDGKQQAEIIALRLSTPPAGFSKWTLRLLADQIVALEIVDSISHQTCPQAAKR